MQREIHDHYFHEAKREGYRSRAAYKLIEIDDRRKVLSKGDLVLDCGAAPGSWLQVAARRVGPKGHVVGIDLKPIEPICNEPNISLIEGDFRTATVDELRSGVVGRNRITRFNTILSDMAPGTTGVRGRDHARSARLCNVLLDRCSELLKPAGHLVMKVYEGEEYPELLSRAKTMFDSVKGFQPKATRKESVEMYVVALGFRPTAQQADNEEAEATVPVRKRPSGWK